jgi:DUF971 family protein
LLSDTLIPVTRLCQIEITGKYAVKIVHANMTEIGVKSYATNLGNKPSPRIPTYNNERNISETN